MGFVGLHFHNASASTAVWAAHLSQKILFFLFQKCNKFVRVSSKAYIDTVSILTTRAREDANFVFIVMYGCKLPARLEPFQKLHTESRLGPIVRKTKVGAYNDKVPWGCRIFRSWKGSTTRIPCRADPGLRQVLPVGTELLILRPGLVNQSQE